MERIRNMAVLGITVLALSPLRLRGAMQAELDDSGQVVGSAETDATAGVLDEDGTRAGECRTDQGCTNYNFNYPPGTFSTTSSDWAIVSASIWPGDYAFYSVTQDFTYEWTLCPADGASAPYSDSQLTLRSENGAILYCHSDDFCSFHAKIRWTATFSGTVLVLVSKWPCQTEEGANTTLLWRREAGGGLPDLAPYQPFGYDDSIVISSNPGDHSDDVPLYDNQTLYVDWAAGNFGTAPTTVTFYIQLKVDGVVRQTLILTPPRNPGSGFGQDDYSIGMLSAGQHTVALDIDFDNRIVESNELNNYYERTIEVLGVGGNLLSAVSRKSNPSGPGGVCELPIDLAPGGTITSDSRQGGITEVVLTYDAAPASGAVTLAHDPTCPGPPSYSAYSGGSSMSCVPSDNLLTCTFTPGLENARTYQLTVPHGAGTTAVEIRGLVGDVNSDGFTNALDRGALIGAWTGATGFTCATDLNRDGSTNALDRGILIGAWTGAQNCAP